MHAHGGAPAPSAPSRDHVSTPLRVLIVEDQATDAELMVLRLEDDGFALQWQRVETEEDFLVALHSSPDIILSDWRLPRFSGLRALELHQEHLPDVPFVVVSGRIGEEAAIDVLRKGAADYVLKDRPTRLGQVVRRAIDDQRHRREGEVAAATIRLQVSALEAAGNAIVITNRDGRIEWVNSAFSELTGYTAQDVLRRNPRELLRSGVHPRSVYMQLWDTILSGRVWHGELTNRRKDGSLYSEEQSITPVRDASGQISHFIAIKQDISEREQREKELATVARVSAAMRQATSTDQSLRIIVDELMERLQATGVAITLPDRRSGESVVECARGSYEPMLAARRPEGAESSDLPHPTDPASREDFVAVPLTVEHEYIGTMLLRRGHPFSNDELRLLHVLANITAGKVQREEMHESTRRAAAELAEAYETTIEGWSRALDYRDHETEGHALRVAEMTVDMARAAHLSDAELVHVRRGALLHDIGKICIPDSILMNTGELSEDEWTLMRLHPQVAFDLLNPIEFLRPALDIPLHHHERWDGSGYPHGLKGEEIPFAARLFAVVDVWDALRFDRRYRKGWPEERVFAHIRERAGTHFDPRAVELFFEGMGVVPCAPDADERTFSE